MRQQGLGNCRDSAALTQNQRQCARCIAQLTAHAQQVAGARAAAAQGLARGHAPKYRQGKAQWTTRGVAADQPQVARLGHDVQATGKRVQPGGFNRRQRQGKGKRNRGGAHGRQITGRHSQRTLTEQERVARICEVHPGYQGVGGDRQLFPEGNIQQGAVVANA